METGEDSNGSSTMKRQREPFSDTEDNIPVPPEVDGGQKRRRVERTGQENRRPVPASSRLIEHDVKADTPVVPSVRSRVQQLTQRREGGPALAQRCLSDPGSESPSLIQNKDFKQNLLGAGEFSQRVELFKAAVLQTSPAQVSANACPRSLSDFVSNIQQKLQGETTPSSKQASRIRQERENELRQLCSQPINDNAWLKRSNSDPSLNEQADSHSDSSVASPEMKDGSYTEASTSFCFKLPEKHTGKNEACDSPSHILPIELKDASWSEQEEKEVEEEREEAYSTTETCQGNSKPDYQHVTNSTMLEEPEREGCTSSGHQQGELGEEAKDSVTVEGLEQVHLERVGRNEAVVSDSAWEEGEEDMSAIVNTMEIGSCDIEEHSMTEQVAGVRRKSPNVSELMSNQSSESCYVKENEESYGCSEAIEPSTDEDSRRWVYSRLRDHSWEESSIAEEVKCTQKGQEENALHEVKNEPESDVEDRVDPSEIQERECCMDMVDTKALCLAQEQQKTIELKSQGEAVGPEKVLTALGKDHEPIVHDTFDGDLEVCESYSVLSGDECLNSDKQGQKPQGLEETVKSIFEGSKEEDDRFEISNEAEVTHEVDSDEVVQEAWKGGHLRHTETQRKELDAGQSILVTHTSNGDDHKDIEPTRQAINTQTTPKDNGADADGNREDTNEVQMMKDVEEAGDNEPCTADKDHGETQEMAEIQTEKANKSVGQRVPKKVNFILVPTLINDSTLSEMDTTDESGRENSASELSSHDETNTAEMIDQMFGEVLEYAEKMEEEEAVDGDSGIDPCAVAKEKIEGEEELRVEVESEGSKELDTSGEELLTFPPSGILSPLSKSMEAVVTPLRLATNQVSNPSSLLLTPEEDLTTPPPTELTDSAPLYSIDAYRTQRQSKLPAIQSVTPRVQRRAQDKSHPQPSINTKEKIAALNEEASKLQTVINQTLQALSCCTDENHGRGSLEEAEAEKLLLVSSEKRSALLAEVVRLRGERGAEEAAGEGEVTAQQPCRGTVVISDVKLPLKVQFVCSSRNRTGRPSHYFFILIRYGPCNIVATPLATAADAKNGDTISFPTSVTLNDIRPNFEIDVEVYSLSHNSGNACSVERGSTKPRVTPRKLLSTITNRSSNTLTSATVPGLSARRSSNFCLVGSHKITLASLGQSKFPLDKMKFEGKIRKLLGDEFQEKVPFLSPLEGNIYLRMDSKSHSNVQHQGFLTMFEVVKGFGVWHRRYFVLEGCHMWYWNHPNDKETKAAEGNLSLSSTSSQCVKPVKRDSCARPFTFELVSNIQALQQDNGPDAIAKCWFSADTKQDRSDWMDKLNQVLLDLHTWGCTSQIQADTQQPRTSSSGGLRESML